MNLTGTKYSDWLKYFLSVVMLISAGVSAPCILCAQDKLVVKKKSLEEIKQQLEEKKQELEKYKAEENRISSDLDSLKKEEKINVGRQQELETQLGRSRVKSSESKEKYESLAKAYKDSQSDLYGETVAYSLRKKFDYPYYGLSDISSALLLKSAIIEKHVLIGRIKGETAKIKGAMQDLTRRNIELKAKKELLDKQRSAHKNILKHKQGELERAREKYSRLAIEVENLHNASQGLTKLVRKLEKQAPYRSSVAKSLELPVPRHSLPWPAQGRIISRFGREEVPLLKTWIVREGIRVRVAESAPVFPVMNGKVIYSGPFRTYGNVVIVDHNQGFFTIYGLLQNILVAKNDSVTPSSPLGRAGQDTQAVSGPADKDYSAFYFEIRMGSEAVDPQIWLTN